MTWLLIMWVIMVLVQYTVEQEDRENEEQVEYGQEETNRASLEGGYCEVLLTK